MPRNFHLTLSSLGHATSPLPSPPRPSTTTTTTPSDRVKLSPKSNSNSLDDTSASSYFNTDPPSPPDGMKRRSPSSSSSSKGLPGAPVQDQNATPQHSPTRSQSYVVSPGPRAPIGRATRMVLSNEMIHGSSMNRNGSGDVMMKSPRSSPSRSSINLPPTLNGGVYNMPVAPVARPHSLVKPRIIHSDRYISFDAADLVSTLLRSSPSSASTSTLAHDDSATRTLVLDIRSHTAFLHSRVRSSLNICVPSTLLRRITYGVDRIAEILSTPEERKQFSAWSKAKMIVVLDLDSVGLVEGNGIASLLAKFEQAGYTGKLGWVRGGYSAVKQEAKSVTGGRDLLASGGSESSSSSATTSSSDTSSTVDTTLSDSTSVSSASSASRPVLQVRQLPVSAFQQASTSTFVHAGLPTETSIGSVTPGRSSRPGLGKRRKSAAESALGLDSRRNSYLSTTPAGETRMATNPFFDNIRQNQEALSLSRSLANLSPVNLDTPPPDIFARLPHFLSSLLSLPPLERAELLARQFYQLEVAERERLEGTMHWHAHIQGKEGIDNPEDAARFGKYGISAGVELGNLNRYKNIFPYDHARVRLKSFPPGSTDYINASHIRLTGSPKRFIASQGPLPSTFCSFWQMCAQEDVGVIVMLTNVFEGGREKCGRYWESDPSGQWDVVVESQDDLNDCVEMGKSTGAGGGFFESTKPSTVPTQTTIRRTISIRRRSDPPDFPARKIRHLQYIAWPDFDVPADPTDVVSLIREVDAAQQEYLAEVQWPSSRPPPPVVCMCSAGIGRTGVFLLVSTLLDKLERERVERESIIATSRRSSMKKRVRSPDLRLHEVDDSQMEMEIDSPPTPHRVIRTANSTSTSVRPLISSDSTSSLTATLSASTLDSPSSFSTAATSTADTEPASPLDLDLPPLLRSDPIFATLNELREQRMSMVGNYRQYVCVVECTLVGALEELSKES